MADRHVVDGERLDRSRDVVHRGLDRGKLGRQGRERGVTFDTERLHVPAMLAGIMRLQVDGEHRNRDVALGFPRQHLDGDAARSRHVSPEPPSKSCFKVPVTILLSLERSGARLATALSGGRPAKVPVAGLNFEPVRQRLAVSLARLDVNDVAAERRLQRG